MNKIISESGRLLTQEEKDEIFNLYWWVERQGIDLSDFLNNLLLERYSKDFWTEDDVFWKDFEYYIQVVTEVIFSAKHISNEIKDDSCFGGKTVLVCTVAIETDTNEDYNSGEIIKDEHEDEEVYMYGPEFDKVYYAMDSVKVDITVDITGIKDKYVEYRRRRYDHEMVKNDKEYKGYKLAQLHNVNKISNEIVLDLDNNARKILDILDAEVKHNALYDEIDGFIEKYELLNQNKYEQRI